MNPHILQAQSSNGECRTHPPRLPLVEALEQALDPDASFWSRTKVLDVIWGFYDREERNG